MGRHLQLSHSNIGNLSLNIYTSNAEPPRKKQKCNDQGFAQLLDEMREKYEKNISSNNSLRHRLNKANQKLGKMKNANGMLMGTILQSKKNETSLNLKLMNHMTEDEKQKKTNAESDESLKGYLKKIKKYKESIKE